MAKWQTLNPIHSGESSGNPFTPEPGVAEAAAVTAIVLAVSVTYREVSLSAHGKVGASPLDCPWSHLELSSLEPILRAALAGLLGAPILL